MRYASLASGSGGNCHAFAEGGRILLLDAGISFKQIRVRLEALGWDPGQVGAVAISHEHSDHVAALPMILKRTPWRILATEDTLRAIQGLRDLEIPEGRWIPLDPGHPMVWEGWRILPFATPHDAADPVAFRLERGGFAAAVATDLGYATALVEEHCADADLLVLEANHDVQMLRDGEYPPQLKARILSRVGHLSNEAMAELLARILAPRLQAVVLAHLSEHNNAPELARFAAEEVLRGRDTLLRVAAQAEPQELSFGNAGAGEN